MRSYWWVDAEQKPLASCEVFTDDAQVGARRGRAITIASVFTEERLRGHGHAGAMMTQVLRSLSSDVLAATLFSEIGVGLYSRLGFFAVPSFDTFFPAANEKPTGVTFHEHAAPLPRHEAPDAQTLRLALSPERLDWQLERERIYGEVLRRPKLEVHGASVGDSSITWTAYWKTNELQVLTLDARDGAATQLIAAARWAAHLAGLPVVRVWETTALASVPHARRLPRTDEIPMFAALAPGVGAWTQVERGLWA